MAEQQYTGIMLCVPPEGPKWRLVLVESVWVKTQLDFLQNGQVETKLLETDGAMLRLSLLMVTCLLNPLVPYGGGRGVYA